MPLGFLIGMSPLMSRALDPFIQVLKPISPLAWMPLALYTIKDSGLSAIFVIFICSVWPMLINTAFGVAAVRKEWINVARTLEVGTLRRAFTIILPAAAPTILTGMRISIGIAWLVIVAAEMLVGGTGIGYFVWNEWNNLSITNVIIAILLIGLVGMLLDQILARFTRAGDVPGVDVRTDNSSRSKAIAKRYPAQDGGDVAVFEDLWLSIQRGEFVCVIGHSGCGKTTVLNILAGLDTPSDGAVIVDGEAIRRHEPRPRGDFPESRAVAVAHRARQCRLRRDVEVAGLVTRQGRRRMRRSSSISSASPAPSTSVRPSFPAA